MFGRVPLTGDSPWPGRPWGYDQGSARTNATKRIKPIKQYVAVGKDAFMCFMDKGFYINLGIGSAGFLSSLIRIMSDRKAIISTKPLMVIDSPPIRTRLSRSPTQLNIRVLRC